MKYINDCEACLRITLKTGGAEGSAQFLQVSREDCALKDDSAQRSRFGADPTRRSRTPKAVRARPSEHARKQLTISVENKSSRLTLSSYADILN